MQNTLKRTHLKGKTNKKQHQRWEIKGGTEQGTLLVIQIKVNLFRTLMVDNCNLRV